MLLNALSDLGVTICNHSPKENHVLSSALYFVIIGYSGGVQGKDELTDLLWYEFRPRPRMSIVQA